MLLIISVINRFASAIKKITINRGLRVTGMDMGVACVFC
jgi:hypothetical protein